MNGKMNAGIVLIIAILSIAVGFFICKTWFSVPVSNSSTANNPFSTIEWKDSSKKIEPHTLNEYHGKQKINLPPGIDSGVVKDLLKKQDSLSLILDSLQVSKVNILDTCWGEPKMCLYLEHYEIENAYKNIKITTEDIKIPSRIETVYLTTPTPPKTWYQQPFVREGVGAAVLVVVYAMARNIK